ncbi:HAMP domain-containing histidine kinase [Clostridium beijerinckii]|uniref:histidine kinase n=2 Tax=Clostridium beijerinckii TaxID=1520 RepID=A0A7X9XQ26_CLOBE|nr:HAMP domain-containing histidine kinase [Clostridium beijerinckii]
MKIFVRRIFFHILSRFVLGVTIFSIVLMVIGYLVDDVIKSFANYEVFKFMDYNKSILFPVIWLLGCFTILVWHWIKTIKYIAIVAEASNSLINSDEEIIHFPLILKEMEDQMNNLRVHVLRKEQIAKEAEQRKNDLVIYLAHDLKTPLTSVIGYLTLLRDEQQISDELKERYVSISLEKAERLEDLINEFFEITRFSLSNLTLELSSVNLTRMLEQIAYEFRPMLAPKNLKCDLKAPSDVMIKCDVKKMERVFDNLMRNAINYSFEDSSITITLSQDESGVKLKFSNYGNTIPEEKLQRIFEQFYRLDTARTSKTGGAGLGLAIAKEIVQLHKGTITAFSKSDVIEFEVFIPVGL